jgi:aminopeptidase N
VFGREYDLDVFNIVAVADFNFGAMENKGLNIFNSRYILADPQTATDADFDAIAAVVAHEYFHNWSGNRITCRDWFQLSLKEGFTVFRDQQFSADHGSAAVERIEDVRVLRAAQFPEDSGPLAHAVRPESYIEIGNFYTATVYNKGAELIRMMPPCWARSGSGAAPISISIASTARPSPATTSWARWRTAAGSISPASGFGTAKPARRR